MRYKGYEALVSFDEDDRILHGRVLNTRDVISFEADTSDNIEQAFRDAIDDYLEQCTESGREPDKSFSGKLILRIDPRLHRDVYLEAARNGTSLNTWIAESLRNRVAADRSP
ncbi:type II toxin-antitoxin system HicB family antitoxin [Candidatus Rariloculus sp.]|uniref:type II toxin-antitoxin system HicB family antitoxin n=1 Tax=Candidatus Rariloculus sp. TaxID=3101265 RepID=UPI003D0CC47F